MIQLKVYKTKGDNDTALFLDLYETEPIKLTLSIEDITQADATSVFSKTFRVPATRHNNEFFENAFEIDGIDFDVTVKNSAEIIVDGAEFRQGHVRLQKIFRNHDLDRIDYELLFLGETRDFSSTIAEKTLCEINMTDFTWEDSEGVTYVEYTDALDYFGPYTKTNIVQSWGAFPENASLTGGFADGNIIFPLINHGNTYDSSNNAQQARIALGTNSDMSFTHATNPLDLTRMKPMIRAKRVWDQIFNDAGYTYTSDFLTSPRFHQMYISAFGNNESIGMDIDQTTGNIFESSETINNLNFVYDYMYNSNTIANASGNYFQGYQGSGSYFNISIASTVDKYYIMEASASIDARAETNYGVPYNVFAYLKIVHVSTGGVVTELARSNYVWNGNVATVNWDSRNGNNVPGSGKIQVYIDSDSIVEQSIVDDSYWNCTAAPGDYYSPYDLDCEYKQIDYIKDILTSFRLVMQPDNKRVNNFIIEPWQEFIGSGVTYDWSDKLVEDMDMVLEPLFNTQSSTIEFSKTEDDDFINKFHQDNNKHPYGWLRFDSANELLKGSRKIEVKGIAPTPIDQIDNDNATPSQQNARWVIPNIYELVGDVSSSGYPNQQPIKTKTRLLFYNGKQTGYPDTALPTADRWYLNDNNPISFWPLVSPYENWPVEQTSLNLNFSNDTRYYIDPSPGTGYFTQGSTLFDEYWSRYISSLYNKYSRRLTAKFILNNVDLQDLTFDDIIFVNGKYYRPEKIIDAEVGSENVVTCQLITLNDQRPTWLDVPLTGFSVATSNTNCIGEQGNIQITTQGTPAFTWSLSVAGAQGVVNPPLLPAGSTYIFSITAPVGIDTLTVTDSLGRTAIVQVDVPESQATPVTSIFAKQNPTICSGTNITPQCNGSVIVVGAGGTGPYTINWLDNNSTSLTRINMCEGSYQYIVYDANDCPSDTYTVVLECATQSGYFVVKQHLGDCTQLSASEYIVNYPINAITPLNVGDTCQIIEIGGCFQVMSTTTNVGVYSAFDPQPDCSSCIDHPHYSWQVESCITPGLFKYVAIGTPFNLVPGQVIDSVEFPDTCWTAISQQNNQSIPIDMTFTQVYDDCASCASASTGYIYKFLSCDGLFDGPIESPVVLSMGSVLDITPGPGCGTVYDTDVAPASYTFTGSILYESCNTCNGISPQVCHTVTATSASMTFDYDFNGASYSLSLVGGDVAAVCAVTGTVIITNGTGTIQISLTTCTSPRACNLPPPPAQTYVIQDCISDLNWTMETQGSAFSLGDVIQYKVGVPGSGATYCGEIVNINNGTPDATLANLFASYTCDDQIHCFQ